MTCSINLYLNMVLNVLPRAPWKAQLSNWSVFLTFVNKRGGLTTTAEQHLFRRFFMLSNHNDVPHSKLFQN